MASNGAEVPAAKRTRLEAPQTEDGEEEMAGNRIVLLLCGSFSPITNLHLRLLGEDQIE